MIFFFGNLEKKMPRLSSRSPKVIIQKTVLYITQFFSKDPFKEPVESKYSMSSVVK